MINAVIIGNGMVGKATGDLFGIEKRFDTNSERSTCSLPQAARSEFIFICLPTEVNMYGHYEVESIVAIVKQLVDDYYSGATFIIRSTVYPGFAAYLKKITGLEKVISNPEFLSEATAEKDIKNPPFILLGGEQGQYFEAVKALYAGRVKGSKFIVTDNITAETAKLMMNAYFSTKVVFANQMYDYCLKNGINYETAKSVLESHPYGPKNHFTIWWNGKRGVNGRCLPKDTKAFAKVTGSELLEKVLQLNEELTAQHQ